MDTRPRPSRDSLSEIDHVSTHVSGMTDETMDETEKLTARVWSEGDAMHTHGYAGGESGVASRARFDYGFFFTPLSWLSLKFLGSHLLVRPRACATYQRQASATNRLAGVLAVLPRAVRLPAGRVSGGGAFRANLRVLFWISNLRASSPGACLQSLGR